MEHTINSGKITITEKEADIMQRYANGQSVQSIGKELAISSRTVEAAMNSVRIKLSVKSSVQAVAELFRNGVLK